MMRYIFTRLEKLSCNYELITKSGNHESHKKIRQIYIPINSFC